MTSWALEPSIHGAHRTQLSLTRTRMVRRSGSEDGILATEFNNLEKGKSAAPNGVFVDPPSLLGSYSHEAMASVIDEGVFNVDGKFNSPVLAIALI